MSGGSYDYLYSKEIEDAIESENWEEMRSRVKYLADVPMLIGAATVESRMGKAEQLVREAQELWKSIGGTLRAIEWKESGDIGEEGLREAFRIFCKENYL